MTTTTTVNKKPELPIELNVQIEKTELAKKLEEKYGSWDLYQHHENDAGYDVKACIESPLVLPPGGFLVVPTGLSVELSSPNYETQVRPRSGLAAKHGISIVNAPGTVDYGYRDEIKIILINHNQTQYVIQPGERIAQLCFRKIPRVSIKSVKEISRDIDRKGGFGSSGKK